MKAILLNKAILQTDQIVNYFVNHFTLASNGHARA
jgi:hypothetical protein